MGITRNGLHKRRSSGGKRKLVRKKRKYELGRQPAKTAIGDRRVRVIRVRGGNKKYRALRLSCGNFAWASEQCTRRGRLVCVSYNATSNELIRTNTLVKGAIVQIDATLFKKWYEMRYGVTVHKGGIQNISLSDRSRRATERISARQEKRALDPALEAQLKGGRLLARITSRPGQTARVDGYILEGKELAFYSRKIAERKKHSK